VLKTCFNTCWGDNSVLLGDKESDLLPGDNDRCLGDNELYNLLIDELDGDLSKLKFSFAFKLKYKT
jgi:hypothetical protein